MKTEVDRGYSPTPDKFVFLKLQSALAFTAVSLLAQKLTLRPMRQRMVSEAEFVNPPSLESPPFDTQIDTLEVPSKRTVRAVVLNREGDDRRKAAFFLVDKGDHAVVTKGGEMKKRRNGKLYRHLHRSSQTPQGGGKRVVLDISNPNHKFRDGTVVTFTPEENEA